METAVDEVRVVIDETRKREPTLKIDYASRGRDLSLYLVIRPDGHDSFAARGEGFSPRGRSIARPYSPVDQREVGRGRGLR
jgi:hypothetical protein